MSRAGTGILACGCYVPRNRLPGNVVAEAHGWFQPSLKSFAKRQRSFCNWDEDALTMAVEASRACMQESGSADVAGVELASTSMPFADRSNAGILREALDIPETVSLSEAGGSMRAGSTALAKAMSSESGAAQLVVAADCIDSKPASPDEASFGHAGAALLVGRGDPIATLRGSASLHQDFVDHYRAANERFSYVLESRWTRDAGYREQVSGVWARALDAAATDTVDHLLIAAPSTLAAAIAKVMKQENAGADLLDRVGYCGAAQPLLLVALALERAKRGETIGVVTIGQGVDAMIFEVVSGGESMRVTSQIEGGKEESNYCRYLAMRRLVDMEQGIRAERDNRTAQSAFWRNRDAITAFKGGQCSKCNTLQFPPSRICVSCGAEDTQSLRRLADMQGSVRSFTEDWLAYTPRPPLVFGNVGLADGANVMMEFTDVEPGELEVGMAVDMRFRIKDLDDRRHFRRYFWKPTPSSEAAA